MANSTESSVSDRPVAQHFPLGGSLTEKELFDDPYAVYERLRREEPVSWIREFNMWYVVGYEEVTRILLDDEVFVTTSHASTIFDTFGPQILSAEGPDHRRLKLCLRAPFRPNAVRDGMEFRIEGLVNKLIGEFSVNGEAELRSQFARRLPVQTMLELFGLEHEDESRLRRWYDSFERALANFKWDQDIRDKARQCANEFHEHIGASVARLAGYADDSLISTLMHAPENQRMDDDEIKRNASIVLFGGISTVEALILNAVWAFSKHPDALDEVRADWSLLPNAIEEVIRWRSPVQSATRHVTEDTEIAGVAIRKGDTVNCMLGAANRDPAAFEDPDSFRIRREFPRSRPHLGFAVGPHNCLGLHLARLEARVALQRLYDQLPNLSVDLRDNRGPVGYEFHQPSSLQVQWG